MSYRYNKYEKIFQHIQIKEGFERDFISTICKSVEISEDERLKIVGKYSLDLLSKLIIDKEFTFHELELFNQIGVLSVIALTVDDVMNQRLPSGVLNVIKWENIVEDIEIIGRDFRTLGYVLTVFISCKDEDWYDFDVMYLRLVFDKRHTETVVNLLKDCNKDFMRTTIGKHTFMDDLYVKAIENIVVACLRDGTLFFKLSNKTKYLVLLMLRGTFGYASLKEVCPMHWCCYQDDLNMLEQLYSSYM